MDREISWGQLYKVLEVQWESKKQDVWEHKDSYFYFLINSFNIFFKTKFSAPSTRMRVDAEEKAFATHFLLEPSGFLSSFIQNHRGSNCIVLVAIKILGAEEEENSAYAVFVSLRIKYI